MITTIHQRPNFFEYDSLGRVIGRSVLEYKFCFIARSLGRQLQKKQLSLTVYNREKNTPWACKDTEASFDNEVRT